MCARQPSQRGPGRAGAAARGRPAGRQRKHPRAARLPAARRDGGRLGLPLGARARVRRPSHHDPARTRAGRLLVGQRDGLHPRQPPRLRRMGRVRLGRGRPASVLHQGRGQRARRLAVARRGRPAAGQRRALGQPHVERVRRRRRAGRAGAQRRLQRRSAGRRRPVPGDPARRHARERRGRLPAPGDGARRT